MEMVFEFFKKLTDDIIKFWAFYIKKSNVVAVLRNKNSLIPSVSYGKNIVTDVGDVYYAKLSAGETPTPASWAGFRLGTSTTPVTKADTDVNTEDSNGRKAIDAGYPLTNDSDPDNTGSGADIVTWRVSYTKAEAVINNIAEGAIVDSLTTPTSALAHWLFSTPFSKTADDTLKVFVNHRFNGV